MSRLTMPEHRDQLDGFRVATVAETLQYGHLGREAFERNGLIPAIAGAHTAQAPTFDIEEREINSEFGQVWVNGFYQQDITAFSGTPTIGRTELPVAGQDRTVYRPTRKTRTGNMNYRKSDSRWEFMILGYMGLSPDDRRALRGLGINPFPEVTLLLVIDDPDSWGAEIIQLNRVRFWSIPIGYGGQDIIERTLDCTWATEQILQAVPRPGEDYIGGPLVQSKKAAGISYGGFGNPTGLPGS